MDELLPDDITPEERAEVAKQRAEKRMLAVLEPVLEKRRCQQWGIEYDAKNPDAHRVELNRVDLALREMVAQHTRNWRWIGATGRVAAAGSASIAGKFWNSLMGALVLLGLAWVAGRLGLKLPGVP